MNELKHHGILGMKWGVRRYQNKDGSLKPSAKGRYSDSKSAKENYKKQKTVKKKKRQKDDEEKRLVNDILEDLDPNDPDYDEIRDLGIDILESMSESE